MGFSTSICAAAVAAALSGTAAAYAGGPPSILTEVHRSVMAEAVYRADPPGQDIWRASTVGDCEDFALEMRQRLAAAGVPYEAMSVLVVWNRRHGTWHAVLLVRAAEAWVLDSLERQPRRWNGKGIEWQVGGQRRRLVAIDGRPVVATAWR